MLVILTWPSRSIPILWVYILILRTCRRICSKEIDRRDRHGKTWMRTSYVYEPLRASKHYMVITRTTLMAPNRTVRPSHLLGPDSSWQWWRPMDTAASDKDCSVRHEIEWGLKRAKAQRYHKCKNVEVVSWNRDPPAALIMRQEGLGYSEYQPVPTIRECKVPTRRSLWSWDTSEEIIKSVPQPYTT